MEVNQLFSLLDKRRRSLELEIESEGERIKANLYLPSTKGEYPGVVFNQGLMPSRTKLDIANAFPRFLTGLGIAVLVPVYEGHLRIQFERRDILHAQHAFETLLAHDEVTGGGFLGFSYGATLSLLAAPRSNPDFVATMAPATDMELWLRYVLTGYKGRPYIQDALKRSWRSYVKQEVIEARALGQRPPYKDFFLADEMVSCEDEGVFDRLLSEMSSRKRFEDLSPLRIASKIKAKCLLVHGRRDAVVPFEHSKMMHEAIRKSGGRAELVGVDGLGHVVTVPDIKAFASYVRRDGKNLLKYVLDFIRSEGEPEKS